MTNATDQNNTNGLVSNDADCSKVTARTHDFVIRLPRSLTPCWIDDSIDGDPGRTLVLAYATRYATENEARENMNAIRREYPRRSYEIEAVPII